MDSRGYIQTLSLVLAYKKKIIRQILAPLLNVAQSLPHFSYLFP